MWGRGTRGGGDDSVGRRWKWRGRRATSFSGYSFWLEEGGTGHRRGENVDKTTRNSVALLKKKLLKKEERGSR